MIENEEKNNYRRTGCYGKHFLISSQPPYPLCHGSSWWNQLFTKGNMDEFSEFESQMGHLFLLDEMIEKLTITVRRLKNETMNRKGAVIEGRIEKWNTNV